MKFYFLTPIFFLIFFCSSQSQTGMRRDSNFIYFQGDLNEYKIDSCLADLLKEVVELDNNQFLFSPAVFYYDLSFDHRDSYRNLSVLPSRWNKSMTLDFKGVIKIGQMFFYAGEISRQTYYLEKQKIRLGFN